MIVQENTFPKINFIGNKEKISNWIFDNIDFRAKTFFDAFSGGCSVSYEAKRRGYTVITNDILKINYYIGKSLIENNKNKINQSDIDQIFSGKPVTGFMYKNYSNVNFFPHECMQLDLYRKNVQKLKTPTKIAIAYVLLRRAMIRKMPYSRFTIPWKTVKLLRDEQYSYKKYGRKRAYHNKSFRDHFVENVHDYNQSIFDNGRQNKSYNTDTFKLLPKIKSDIIYLDPPYVDTMNDYHGFYGILDNFIKSKITTPFENSFIKKESSIMLFDKLFSSLSNFKYWILSYNNNSYPDIKTMKTILNKYSSDIKIITRKHNYQISGSIMKSKNKECLFIVRNR